MSSRRLRVFISSKQEELDDERQIAREVVESFDFEPLMSELREASPNSARSICLQEARKSDVYLGIFAKKYSEPTEAEYKEATKSSVPCLIFVKKMRENEHRDKALNELLEEIRHPTEGRWISNFEHVIELREKMRTSLLRLLTSGFLRARAREKQGVRA
jgi:hypothetical protein